jgi:UPF0176 protein
MVPTPSIAAAFYKFVALPDFADLQPRLLACCERHSIRGTVLLAAEGINGTIAGAPDDIRAVLAWLRQDERLADLEHKESPAATQPFRRLKVRLKREIVTLGVPGVDAAKMAGTYVRPEDWNALVDDPDVVMVDVRNDYEVAIGSFEGAVNPRTHRFGELPAWIERDGHLRSKPKVAMFCTGGIRCEKSTAYLRSLGFDEVFHLQGGILKYLETVPESESRWRGECFVFDERVAVGHGLAPGHHTLCRACRRPLAQSDRASPLFVEGVSCPYCHDVTSGEQKNGFAERQRQVALADRASVPHIAARMPAKRRPVSGSSGTIEDPADSAE